jgi:hypothetical protein
MTGRIIARPADYVLTLFLTLRIIWARPVLIPARRGRAREASQMWGGERSCSRPRTPVGGRPLAALCWSKSKRLTVPRARRRPALPIPPYPSSRAAQPPSIKLMAQGSQALGLRVLALGQTHRPCACHHTLSRHGRACPGHPDQTSAAFPSSGSPAPIPGPSPGRGRGEAGHDDIRHAPAPRSRPDPRSFPAREQSVRQTAPGPVPRRRAMFTPSARRKIIFPPFTTDMIEGSRLILP